MPKTFLEKAIEAPAEALQLGVAGGQKIASNIPRPSGTPIKKAKSYWYMLGPGLTTGASDDDPSGIATYSQAGARYGFGLLWMALFTFPLMSLVQEMCARIGLVTGRGLAGNIRRHFSRRVLYFTALCLFAANAFNIGADIGAMAQAVQLLAPNVSFTFLVFGITASILLLQIYTPYVRYARYLKWLAMVLAAYIISAFLAHPDWGNVLSNTFIVRLTFNKDQLLLVCAVLGTTISPYLFFWQTSQEVEEQVASGQTTIAQREGTNKRAVKKMRVDVWSGMFLSNLVMFFIIVACGSVLFTKGITDITSAAQAAEAMRPLAGNATYLLFAVGIIGTGLLAIPVLAGSSSYAVSEALGKRQGLNSKLKNAYLFYGVIIISMLVGLGLNFIGLNPIRALIYSAVANGIVAPIVLVQILLIARNKKIMGEWVNKKSTTFVGWCIALLMAVAGIAAIYALFT